MNKYKHNFKVGDYVSPNRNLIFSDGSISFTKNIPYKIQNIEPDGDIYLIDNQMSDHWTGEWCEEFHLLTPQECCIYEILKIIEKKKWFNKLNNNLKIIKDHIFFNRKTAKSIYVNSKHSIERCDKYFIEIVNDILKKYNINEFGFVNDSFIIYDLYNKVQNNWIKVNNYLL